jgi:hypothetical protein
MTVGFLNTAGVLAEIEEVAGPQFRIVLGGMELKDQDRAMLFEGPGLFIVNRAKRPFVVLGKTVDGVILFEYFAPEKATTAHQWTVPPVGIATVGVRDY